MSKSVDNWGELDKILTDYLFECNDGPTPFCSDESLDYKYRNKIVKFFDAQRQQTLKQLEGLKYKEVKHKDYIDYPGSKDSSETINRYVWNAAITKAQESINQTKGE